LRGGEVGEAHGIGKVIKNARLQWRQIAAPQSQPGNVAGMAAQEIGNFLPG